MFRGASAPLLFDTTKSLMIELLDAWWAYLFCKVLFWGLLYSFLTWLFDRIIFWKK